MDNTKNNAKNNAQNCGKNNKPVDVKQDNKNSTYRADKLFNDTAVGGNRPTRNRRDDEETDF